MNEVGFLIVKVSMLCLFMPYIFLWITMLMLNSWWWLSAGSIVYISLHVTSVISLYVQCILLKSLEARKAWLKSQFAAEVFPHPGIRSRRWNVGGEGKKSYWSRMWNFRLPGSACRKRKVEIGGKDKAERVVSDSRSLRSEGGSAEGF